jgi:plasmid stabilization system protein ParE
VARVAWSRPALADLSGIRRFIARDSSRHARATVERIKTDAARLSTFPLCGRAVPEYGTGVYREIIVDPYRILYHHVEDEYLALVMAVIHGARILPVDIGNGEAR